MLVISLDGWLGMEMCMSRGIWHHKCIEGRNKKTKKLQILKVFVQAREDYLRPQKVTEHSFHFTPHATDSYPHHLTKHCY